MESALAPPIQLMPTGTCVMAEGVLQQSTMKGKHVIELKVEKLLHVGTVDQEKYPLSKKRLPLEMLRDYSHFRPRTTTVRIRILFFRRSSSMVNLNLRCNHSIKGHS